ncbi:MAG: FadR/GntR family transcriptional regulator [Lachnospiraceae bacterium]
MYQFEKMNKKLLGSQVEDELMNYILQEPIQIGDKIPNEFELAEKFGVGRSTIREAVKGLVSKGVLEVRRGSGTYVISTCSTEDDPLKLARFQDKYKLALELSEVRLMIEPEIAALAAEYADEQEKQMLENLCDTVEQMYLEGKNHLPKDIEFHTFIASCSKNRVVETLVPIINTAVMTFGNLTHRKLQKETIETHRAITEAIKRGDSVGAKCAMIMHLTYNRQMLMRMWEENKQKQNTDAAMLEGKKDTAGELFFE